MLTVGLTGGIGSGKSTVAGMLARCGAVIVDVDALGRDVIGRGGRAERAVVEAFGPDVCNAEGHVDRARLAATVFGRADALARLTAISHPAINAELADVLRRQSDEAVVVLDMAILVESTLGRGDPAHSNTRVVTVEAPPALRIERAVTRGMNRLDVEARMAMQATDEQRRAVADLVIVNAGDLESLSVQVENAWERLAGWHATRHDQRRQR